MGSMRLTRIAGAFTAVLWMVFSVTLIIWLTAGNGEYLADEMLKNAPPEVSRLPEAEYPGVGDMTAGYLTGQTERFQYEYTGADGNTVACFQEHEEAHMADCRKLIRLDRTVMFISGGLLLILAGTGILNRGGRREFCRGILRGLLGVFAVASILMFWAIGDFDGLFVTFHRVAFTNDGWLLNPATDMLIRLMPEQFFIRLGVRGLFWLAASTAVLAAGAGLGMRSREAGKR
jgi:integral membrane protein (TIGR01906 family)